MNVYQLKEKLNEPTEIEEYDIGEAIGDLIVETIAVIAQLHIYHWLATSGQKHTALNELYLGLQEEVDTLAERFISTGGELPEESEVELESNYNDVYVLELIESYREMVTDVIGNCNAPEMSAVKDSVIDLQEVIDSKMYLFKLK